MEKLECLKSEIDKYQETYRRKRHQYERLVTICNMLTSCLTPLAAFFLFLSYVFTEFGDMWKGLALLLCIFSSLVAYWGKSYNYGAKLLQRGTTYFALCNLSRVIRYSLDPERRCTEFAKRFEEIMKRDNEMSLANSTEIVGLMNQNCMKSIKIGETIFQEKQDGDTSYV